MDTYEVTYLPKFSTEFSNYPEYQQDKVLDFVEIFEEHGLSDFTKYEGKIVPSWSNLKYYEPNYRYTRNNHLWHYHVGVPEFEQVHGRYKTSKVVLHFQWENKGNSINLVDLYDHYLMDGSFYLPPALYLVK